MKKLYYISGLGADERVFSYLNIQGIDTNYIHWEVPQKHEPLGNYCDRLIEQIDLNNEVILVGVSFGGIIAQEISRRIKVDKVIIISSIKSGTEFNWQLKMVRFLKLHKVVPSWFLKWSNLLTADYYFGTKTKAESDLLKLIIKDTDPLFMKWAIAEIMKWNNANVISDQEIFHIHGTHDHVFPMDNIKNAIPIPEGGHFMIVNRAKEVSEMIEKQIN
jgi:pimeloyl-ACP methyl ester carboxylesterase